MNFEVNEDTTYGDLLKQIEEEINETDDYEAQINTNQYGEISLEVSAKDSGKDNNFNISGKLADTIGINKVSVAASDLEIELGDDKLSSTTNRIDILEGGLTLDFTNTEDNQVTIEVEDDLTELADEIENLVNKMNDFMNDASKYDSEGLNLFNSQLKNIVSESADSLKLFGVSVTEKNLLEFNRDKILNGTTEKEELADAAKRYDSFFNRIERKTEQALEVPITNYLPREVAEEDEEIEPVLFNYLNTSQKVALNNYLGAGAIIDYFF
jgi:hypothetical protein